jgi:hypothetical protein
MMRIGLILILLLFELAEWLALFFYGYSKISCVKIKEKPSDQKLEK